MRAKKWTFICSTTAAALVSSFVTSASMAQTCETAVQVALGDNAVGNAAGTPNQLTQSTVAGGTTTIYNVAWYAFTPASTGPYVLSLCGSAFDTKMAIATACPTSATTSWPVVAYNDDTCACSSGCGAAGNAAWASKLSPSTGGIPLTSDLVAGTTYYVGIGGYAAVDVGTANLNISFAPPPAAGSDCAAPLVAVEGSNPFDSTDSGTPTAIVGCGTNHNIYKSIYFSFVAPADDTYTFSLCGGATFDTRIAVMNDCVPANGVLGCNDDLCALQSQTSANLTAGQTCIVVVGGYGTTGGGAGALAISAGGGGGGGGGCDLATATAVIEGPNDFATTIGSGNLDLTGICDPGTFGDDLLYNVTYYRFTPTQDGIWTATTCATATWDTRLAILGSCDPFSAVACNDDGPAACTNFTSTVEFTGTTGVEVVVAVGGYAAGNSGIGTLTMIYGSTVIACGDPAAGDCCVANTTASCNDEACCTAVCAADAFCCESQWDQICADQAALLCGACGAGSCKLPAPTATEAELCGEDLNGGCNSAGETEAIAVGDIMGGTFWADADTRDTDWYTLNLAEATEVTLTIYSNMPCFAAFVDTACGGIVGTPTTGNCGGTTTFCFPPGQYLVVALPGVFAGFPCGFEFGNDYSLAVTGIACDASAPANDNCVDAAVAVVGANPFDNTFASTEIADPSCGFGGTAFTKDVWFVFTPDTTGAVVLETCSGATPFDTGIEVWSACPAAGGTILGCNDDGTGCAAFASSLNINMDAGVTYTIRVGGWAGATGATDLVIGAGVPGPKNDECSAALPVLIGSTPFDTTGATGITAACTKFGNPNIFNDLWYSYSAAGDGECIISLCGSAYDTKIAVFAGGCDGALVACNDDTDVCGPGLLQSKVFFTPVCGTTYYISVGGFGAASFGAGTIDITQQGKCGTACPGDFDGDGFVSAADLSALLLAWGGPGGDIDGDGTTNAADLSALLYNWGACP